jgi:hypothetical protein
VPCGRVPSKPGWRKFLPVLVRINGEPAEAWPINMMPAGEGSFYLYVHGDIRKASGTAVGDRVRVEVEFDASYQNGAQHPMPRWFKQALAANSQAMKNWAALIPSRKKEILRYFSRRNSPDARARSLAKAFTCFPVKPADSWRAHGKTDRRRIEWVPASNKLQSSGLNRDREQKANNYGMRQPRRKRDDCHQR